MKQAIVKIGNKQYLVESLKGYTQSKFLKEKQGTKEDWEKLKEFIKPKKQNG